MLYQISNGAVAFGDDVILHSIDFEIRNTEKIAIVGRNGCGKTTLLKLISGEVEMEKLDSDESAFIAKAGNPVIISRMTGDLVCMRSLYHKSKHNASYFLVQ